MIKSGIYEDLSNEDYHADKNSISRSSLKDFYKNPYYYWSMHLSGERPIKIPTPEMVFGTAFHTFILEPDKFNNLYAIEPQRVLLKDVGREEYEQYKEKCEELKKSYKTVISQEDYNNLLLMRSSLMRDERIQEILVGGEIEKSYFWEDENSGLMIKARPDILQRNMIIDLKTIGDASLYSFQRSMVEGWYHVQGSMIRDAVRLLEDRHIPNVINICIEKKYPYCIGIYLIDEAALDYGQQLYKDILLDMKSCINNNKFTDYSIQTVGLPKWAMT